LLGAIPYVISIDATYLDAFFETMSGFTTTGITMFVGLDGMPLSILFWRALTQWVGGLGILTFFLAVAFRSGSAHRLFGAESHKLDVGRPVPGLANTIKILWSIYAGFTVFIALALWAAGMGVFDSICHSFTALSTGGFSPHDASIEYYRISGHCNFVWIEYTLIVGMLMGGTSFLVHYRIIKGRWRALIDNTEMRLWWGILASFVLIILAERIASVGFPRGFSPGEPFFWTQMEEWFRTTAFQVVSILTTTGFATKDIAGSFFGHVARQLFLVMMLVGGCVGSTGGGLKVLRVAILFRSVKRQMNRLIASRRSVSSLMLDGKPIRSEQIESAHTIFFAWIILLVVGGVVTAYLSWFDGYRSLSGMFSALGNIGPCFIPADAMGQLHPIVKLTYILGMLAGRLEILPVLLLFSTRAWRASSSKRR
jgi:trk system potassium uptake protein TrkH